MKKAAFCDALTRLPNRRHLEDTFDMARAAADRNGTKVAFLLIDLDHFKEINDELGHDAGDAVLMNTTQRLSSIVRRNEMVARLGGDEFAIILGEIRDDNTIEPLCIRIVQELRAPILYNLHTIEITPSLGVALYPK